MCHWSVAKMPRSEKCAGNSRVPINIYTFGRSSFRARRRKPHARRRGASRYYHPEYKEGFLLEAAAVKRVREEMGLHNLKVMVPSAERRGRPEGAGDDGGRRPGARQGGLSARVQESVLRGLERLKQHRSKSAVAEH